MAAITVTAAESGTTFNGILLRLRVLTSVAASQAGAGTGTKSSGSSVALNAAIMTTVAGSQVYGAIAEVGGTTLVAAAGSTIVDSVTDGANGAVYGTCRTTSATVTPGATTVGSSTVLPGGVAVLEVLPNGTITEDASSPAVVSTTAAPTITTASFTPPAGSLLVAMVSADASVATIITVSDSSSLIWTQQVVAQSAGALYAGVWTAQIAAAAGAASALGAPADDEMSWSKLRLLGVA